MLVEEKMKQVIKKHNLMHIASIGLDGIPRVRGVDYVEGESDNILYFITHKMTNKVGEIEKDGRVSIVIDHDCLNMADLANLIYLKAIGQAEVIREPGKCKEIFGRILQKFPYLKDLPGDSSDFVGIKLVLKEVFLTDNNVGFGNTETISF